MSSAEEKWKAHISRGGLGSSNGEDGRNDPPSTGGGGGGIYNTMDARITALETHFGYVRRDMDELKAGQGEIHKALVDVSGTLSRVASQNATDKAEVRADLAKLPTRDELSSWKLQWTAIGFAMVALTIGGIIGGLSWISGG